MSITATALHEILDPGLLGSMIERGFVRSQRHPTLPLAIHNYTPACQFANEWNAATLACRGLIVADGGAVVARPFAKFFNHGQPGAPVIDLGEAVTVTDKADGSLGIVYPAEEARPAGAIASSWAVATRGSFASEQALHATELLRTRYPGFEPPPGLTVLVEIVYPGNRIVLDYGGLDDLVLLGAVDIATGRSSGPEAVPAWPGPVVDRFHYATLGEALASAPRPNREGLVIHVRSSDVRVKIKYEEYVRLHRIVTGLTARTVWEHLAAGHDVAQLVDGLPDEFHTWVSAVADELRAQVAVAAAGVEAAYESIVESLPAGFVRKDFALAAAAHPDRSCLFLRLDNRDYTPLLWQRARPEADWTPRAQNSEDGDE